MGLLNVITNQVKAAVGYQQNFAELLSAKDVSRALNFMSDHSDTAIKNMMEYNVETHKVMERKDKAVYDKKGSFVRWHKRWKIPVPYQQFINEVALVFLYGRPVKWLQESEGTDDAFQAYKNLMKEVRFDAHVRECKRLAGAEGAAAILYHTYRNSDNEPKLLLNVLAKSNGDDILTIKDQYKRLTAFGWGYTLTEAGGKSVYHIDIYTSDSIYRCKRIAVGWEVVAIANDIGKIPVILFEQEVEHSGVQPMIDRIEAMESTDADVNDRFANPAMVATTEILNNLPKAEEEAKLYILKNGGEIKYLTWDQASESKKNEYARLDQHILSKSFTPNVDFDNMKALSNISAKALKQMMMLAVIKAEKRKETHDGYMNRAGNLARAILANVLDYAKKAQYDALVVGHEFQEPFGEDMSEALADVLKQFGAGALSLQTTLEMSYIVKNAKIEMDRIKQEQTEAIQRQKDLNKIDVFEEAE